MLNKLMYKSLGTLGFLLKVLGQDVDTADDEGLGKKLCAPQSDAQGSWYLLRAFGSCELGIVYELDRSVVGIDCVTDDDCDANQACLINTCITLENPRP